MKFFINNKFEYILKKVTFLIDNFLIEGKILRGVNALVIEEDN